MPDTPIAIVPLTPQDADDYRRVRLRALTEHPDAFRSDAEEEAAKPIQWWLERLAPRERSGASFFGARVPGHGLVGTAGVLFERRRKLRHTATLVGMYVAPERARRGVGRALCVACIELVQADPAIEMLYLTVTATNDVAIRLYERMGFVAYGREPRSIRIGDRAFDKLMMALALRPA